jgi:transcriptional regulator with XRE-family HTH domain
VDGRLRALRRAKFLTQTELAQQVGVSFQTVQAWEAGKYQPRLRHLKRLCEVLGVTPEQLIETGGKAAA